MGRQKQKSHLLRVLLLLFLLMGACSLISACSAQQKQSDDDFLMGTNDPFKDSFFTDAGQWDSSVLKQSEVLSQDVPKDPEEPKTWHEKSEEILIGAVIVGGTVAKLMFMPML